MQLNLMLFVIEALANNKKIQKDIDNLYKKKKYEFYKVAKESELYNHPMLNEGSLLQDEYAKKVLGILLELPNDEEIGIEVTKMIQKVYRWTYTYVENHNVINCQDYYRSFRKKFKGVYDADNNLIDYNFTILMLLSAGNGREIIKDNTYNETLARMSLRMEHCTGEHVSRININRIKEEDKDKIKKLKQEIFDKYGKIRNYEDIMTDRFEDKKMDQCAFLFDYERLFCDSIFRDIKFTDQNIDEILYLYVNGEKDLHNIEKAAEFLISYIYLMYMIKAYKQVKDMYFKNNKETMNVELEGLEKTLDSANIELSVAKRDLSEVQKVRTNLEKENERLRKELEEAKRNKNELSGLREFVFNLDNQVIYEEEKIEYEALKGYKAIFVGGHEKWQKRMKESLPNFIFIHTDNLNFDTKIVNNVNVVFIYPNYLNHGMYYKLMSSIEGKDIKVVYLNQITEERVLQTIYKALKEKEN